MNKTFLWNAFLNSPQFLGSPAGACGWWIGLQRHCSEQETGGVVRGARAFSAMQWTMLLGAGGGIHAINRIVEVGLAQWSGDDLIVAGYHLDSEKTYQDRRTGGSKGGRAKAEKDRREREKKDRERRDQSGEPGSDGLGSSGGTGSATGSAVAHKESRGSDSWGRGGEGEEREGEGSKVLVPFSVPQSSDQIVDLFKALHQKCLGTPYSVSAADTMSTRAKWDDLEPDELPERINIYLHTKGSGQPSITGSLGWYPGPGGRQGQGRARSAMSVDVTTVAALLSALTEIPTRLAALEREQARAAAELTRLHASLPPMLVSIPEAAGVFKVSVPTMRRWVRAGEVPTVKVANTVRVDLSRVRGVDGAALATLISIGQGRRARTDGHESA